MRLEEEVLVLRRENQELRARIAQLESQLAKAKKHFGNSSKAPSGDITEPPKRRR